MKRVIKMTFNGEDIDEQRVYSFATVTYLLKGGDGFSALKNATPIDHPKNGHRIFDIVVDWIEHNHTLKAQLEGRIVDIAREKVPFKFKWSGEKEGSDEVIEGDNLTF